MSEDMLERHSESIHEMRRRAPGHFLAKAENARMAAHYLLSMFNDGTFRKAADAIGYSGSPDIVIAEAFRREAAIALELIIKARIAFNIERGVGPKGCTKPPSNHNVVQLWAMAGLPALSADDQLILYRVKSLLEWSGRYAEPKTDAAYQKEMDQEDAIYLQTGRDRLFRRYPSFDWECFDRLYQLARQRDD
jgi:hypothetical protein